MNYKCILFKRGYYKVTWNNNKIWIFIGGLVNITLSFQDYFNASSNDMDEGNILSLIGNWVKNRTKRIACGAFRKYSEAKIKDPNPTWKWNQLHCTWKELISLNYKKSIEWIRRLTKVEGYYIDTLQEWKSKNGPERRWNGNLELKKRSTRRFWAFTMVGWQPKWCDNLYKNTPKMYGVNWIEKGQRKSSCHVKFNTICSIQKFQ